MVGTREKNYQAKLSNDVNSFVEKDNIRFDDKMEINTDKENEDNISLLSLSDHAHSSNPCQYTYSYNAKNSFLGYNALLFSFIILICLNCFKDPNLCSSFVHAFA